MPREALILPRFPAKSPLFQQNSTSGRASAIPGKKKEHTEHSMQIESQEENEKK
jgi:hypothetical protein